MLALCCEAVSYVFRPVVCLLYQILSAFNFIKMDLKILEISECFLSALLRSDEVGEEDYKINHPEIYYGMISKNLKLFIHQIV